MQTWVFGLDRGEEVSQAPNPNTQAIPPGPKRLSRRFTTARIFAVIAAASLLTCLSYIFWGIPALTYTLICVERKGDSLLFTDGVTIYGDVEGSDCHMHWGMELNAIYAVDGNREDVSLKFWGMSDDSPMVFFRGKTVSLPQGAILSSSRNSLSVKNH